MSSKSKQTSVTDPYTYTCPNGFELTIPPMGKSVSARWLRKNRRASPLDMLFYVIETAYKDDMDTVDEALDTMHDDELGDLLEGWQTHSRANAGESSAS